MGSFADYAEKKVLDLVFGATAFSAPATLYFGLSTTTITDAGGNITEPSGNNYSRVAVTNNGTNFTAATGSGAGGSSKTSGADITFPTASGSWGACTDWFISDASSSGNIIAYGALTVSKTITSGDTAKIATGDITITLD